MPEERISLSLAEIDARIAEHKEQAKLHTKEAERLESLKSLAIEIGQPQPMIGSMSARISGSAVVFGKIGELTSDLAEKLLREHGKMHIDALIETMKKNKWEGSGDPHKDYKNVHNNLSRKPKRFVSLGGSFFDVVRR